jgi:hypothetical protein
MVRSETPRHICPICRGSFTLRKDGNIRRHECLSASTSTNSSSIDETLDESTQSNRSTATTQLDNDQSSSSQATSNSDNILLRSNHTESTIPDLPLADLPPTFPNIFYKPSDERVVINWFPTWP